MRMENIDQSLDSNQNHCEPTVNLPKPGAVRYHSATLIPVGAKLEHIFTWVSQHPDLSGNPDFEISEIRTFPDFRNFNCGNFFVSHFVYMYLDAASRGTVRLQLYHLPGRDLLKRTSAHGCRTKLGCPFDATPINGT